MEIKLGKLRVEVGSIALYGNSIDRRVLAEAFRRVKLQDTIYRWNCQTQTGDQPRRRNVRLLTSYAVAPRYVSTPSGSSPMPVDALWHAASGLSKNEFGLAIRRAFPNMVVSVDWNRLWRQYKDDYSLDVKYQSRYLLTVARPYGLNLEDHMFILTPSEVTIMSVVTGRCRNGTRPNGNIIEGDTFPRFLGTSPADANFRELEEQVVREDEEAQDQKERMTEELSDHPLFGPMFPRPEPEEDDDGDNDGDENH